MKRILSLLLSIPLLLSTALSVLLFAGQGWGATYYANNASVSTCVGTSQAITDSGDHNCAWNSLVKVNAATLNGGDSVLFVRGGTFTTYLVPKAGVTYGNYGTGALPVIDATSQLRAINITDKTDVIIDGLDCRNNTSIGGGILITGTSSNITVKNSAVSAVPGTGIAVGGAGGHTIQDNTVTIATVGGTGIVVTGGTSNVSGNTINCSVADKSTLTTSYGISIVSNSNMIYGNTINGFYKNILVSGNVNQIRNNTIQNGGNGLVYPNSNGYGIHITAASSGNNTYSNTILSNVRGYCDESTDTGTGGNIVTRNIVKNSTVNGIDLRSEETTNPMICENNTVIHSPNGDAGHGIVVQVSGVKADIYNNLITCDKDSTDKNIQAIAISGPYTDVKVDNNLYYVTNGCMVGLIDGTEYTDLAAWQSAISGVAAITGKDSNSIEANPKFRSATDYRLQPSSPCINKGTNVGLTTDYLGHSLRGTPDIGAYEYYGQTGGRLGPKFKYGW